MAMTMEKEVVPPDIIQSILLLQPTKSLLRFKTVCKSWNAIISNYDFAKKHLQQSKSSTRTHNILMGKGILEYYVANFEDGNFKDGTLCQKPYRGRIVLCSGDGLALLSTSSSESYLLWNPCSNQKTDIPCNEHLSPRFGICRGPSLDDYKIVANDFDCYTVYSCKTESWSKKKEFPFSDTGISRREGGLFVDGFSFWLASFSSHILYFDPRDDEFKKLKKPMEIETKLNDRFVITSLRDCLCVFDYVSIATARPPGLRVWMLRDNNVDSVSWSKLMTIYNVYNQFSLSKTITPLFLTYKNELVMTSGYVEEEIGVYYKSTKYTYKKFDAPQAWIGCRTFFSAPCLNTLFFPMSIKSKN